MKHIYESLLKIQSELKAPKNQRNNFGGYNYRSCEDIMEAVKPILKENNVVLTVSDDIILVGNRIYVKATATLSDGEDVISNSAFARESETKKGMDDSQITGSASSYARKYALNGLFCIDDTKDADATNTHGAETLKNEIKAEKARQTKEINKKVAEYQKSKEGVIERLKNAQAYLSKIKQLEPYGRDKILMTKITDLSNDMFALGLNDEMAELDKIVNEKMPKEEEDCITY